MAIFSKETDFLEALRKSSFALESCPRNRYSCDLRRCEG